MNKRRLLLTIISGLFCISVQAQDIRSVNISLPALDPDYMLPYGIKVGIQHRTEERGTGGLFEFAYILGYDESVSCGIFESKVLNDRSRLQFPLSAGLGGWYIGGEGIGPFVGLKANAIFYLTNSFGITAGADWYGGATIQSSVYDFTTIFDFNFGLIFTWQSNSRRR